MYVPASNAWTDDDAVRGFVRDVAAGDLVTVDADGLPRATFLPLVWEGDRVIAHFARANDHWQSIADGAPVLLTINGPHAYVSPSWYPAKAEHGRVVPTWNYSAVHLRGRARVFTDAASLREAVGMLTAAHESSRPSPWAVSDAPERYIDGMLRAIVGIEVVVESVEAKAKLSQNRSGPDQVGVVEGLRAGPTSRGEHQVADAMAQGLSS